MLQLDNNQASLVVIIIKSMVIIQQYLVGTIMELQEYIVLLTEDSLIILLGHLCGVE